MTIGTIVNNIDMQRVFYQKSLATAVLVSVMKIRNNILFEQTIN